MCILLYVYIIVFSEFYNLTDVRHKEKSNRHDRQTDSGQTRTNLNQNDPSSLMTNVQCSFFIVKPCIVFTYLLWPVVKPCIVFTYFGHKTINNYFYLVLLNFVWFSHLFIVLWKILAVSLLECVLLVSEFSLLVS